MSHCQHKERGEELKVCPFCGSAAYLTEGGDGEGWLVSCERCYCVMGEGYDLRLGFHGMFKTEEEAIQAWNRREHG